MQAEPSSCAEASLKRNSNAVAAILSGPGAAAIVETETDCVAQR